MFVSCNPEGGAQPSWTIRRASNILNRLNCSNQNCFTRSRDSVETVHLMDAVDVGGSRIFEHRLIPLRGTIVGMAGRIGPKVGFIFNNVSGSTSPTITNPQYLTQQIP